MWTGTKQTSRTIMRKPRLRQAGNSASSSATARSGRFPSRFAPQIPGSHRSPQIQVQIGHLPEHAVDRRKRRCEPRARMGGVHDGEAG